MAASRIFLSRLSLRSPSLSSKLQNKPSISSSPLKTAFSSASKSQISDSMNRISRNSRLPVLGSLITMMPLHSAIASARLQSILSSESQSWGLIPQETSPTGYSIEPRGKGSLGDPVFPIDSLQQVSPSKYIFKKYKIITEIDSPYVERQVLLATPFSHSRGSLGDPFFLVASLLGAVNFGRYHLVVIGFHLKHIRKANPKKATQCLYDGITYLLVSNLADFSVSAQDFRFRTLADFCLDTSRT